VIAKVVPEMVIASCRQTLGLPTDNKVYIDDKLLVALLRRSAGIHCPCSRTTLRNSLIESLKFLHEDEATLSNRIDEIIEGLIIGGDLLELNDVTIEDPLVRGTWVFAAPPSFVVRPSGSIFLFGIVSDQETFLPQSLASRVRYEGFTRVITPLPGEELPLRLREQGLQQLSEGAWIKCPRAETAADMLNRYKRLLLSQPLSGIVKDLDILDPIRPVTYYKGRWATASNQSGTFIARRPQEFGVPLWCFAELKSGKLVRLLDLSSGKTRWRACDLAWHLQMAIDCLCHSPQRYRRRNSNDGVRFDFFSPLPLWSQRRLMVFGCAIQRDASLMSYRLPIAEAKTEEHFLRERLWLIPSEDSN